MKKSKTLTFFLSFVPGVGHYYLEHMQRGLQFNLIFFGLIFVLGITGIGILGIFLPVIWFYGVFDALQIANMLQRGEPVSDRPLAPWNTLPVKARTVGWVLVIIGVYSFLMVNRHFFERWLRFFPFGPRLDNMLVALLLVGFGIYLMAGTANGSDGAVKSGGGSVE